ncbi:MAG: prolipoprotein diacylglyceryl transferase [Deltaproteobacteria bacterium]|nr:prolipoprotein diacylglyceryl transferase [Deltaproteobacteria bacterium]
MGFIIIFLGFIGARLFYVLLNWNAYRAHPLDILKVWEGGLVFSGGLVVALLGLGLYIRGHRLSFWKIGDIWAPGAALGQAIGRIGCFMAGCCFGKPTQMPWAVVFTSTDSLAPLGIPLHPTQIYAALSGVIVFIVLMLLHAGKQFKGQILIWFLILHSISRIILERFRGDDRGFIPGTEMTTTQLIATLILIASVATLLVMKTKQESKNQM